MREPFLQPVSIPTPFSHQEAARLAAIPKPAAPEQRFRTRPKHNILSACMLSEQSFLNFLVTYLLRIYQEKYKK